MCLSIKLSIDMRITIRPFGILKEIIKNEGINLSNVPDVITLQNILNEEYPKINKFYYVLSVNNEIVDENYRFSNNDEVALIPPFAGG